MLRKIHTDIFRQQNVITGSSRFPNSLPACYRPVSQAQRHGADLPGRKSGDEGLHLAADAPHELGHGGAVDAAQVQLFLRNMRPSDTTSWWNRFRYKLLRTHFNDSAQFRVAYGELFMSFFGNNFLQNLLQTLAEFSLNKGGGSLAARARRAVITHMRSRSKNFTGYNCNNIGYRYRPTFLCYTKK